MIEMNKKLILLLSALIVLGTVPCAMAVPGPFGYDLQKDINRKSEPAPSPEQRPKADYNNSSQAPQAPQSTPALQSSPVTSSLDTPIISSVIEINPKLYPAPNLNNAMNSYKKGNYTGCLQELFALVKKQPNNAKAYYYMGMAFTHLGDRDAATLAYEKVILLNPNQVLVDYANKGRDCLIGGPACHPVEAVIEDFGPMDPLDEFINAPYGNGFSPELNSEIRKKELENIQNTINRKPQLSPTDIEKIKKFDSNKTENITGEKLALADSQPSNDDIVSALDTLKRAGMNVSIQPTTLPAMTGYQNPQMNEVSMMLGNNQNNNNSNDMMNMLPYMMQSGQNGANNMNPQVIQAMMMNSMLHNMDFNSPNDKN